MIFPTHQLSQNSSTEELPPAVGSCPTRSWRYRLGAHNWAPSADNKHDDSFVFSLRSGEDSGIAHLTSKRGSCGLSSKSICLRSYQTTPPFNTKPEERHPWGFGICCHVWYMISQVFRQLKEIKPFKEHFRNHNVTVKTSVFSEIKYLLRLFGHYTL